MCSISVSLSHMILQSGVSMSQKVINGMWRTKVQVYSEDSSAHIVLGVSLAGSVMVSVKTSCVLGEVWVTH